MKKSISILITTLLLLSLGVPAFAHSGGTDSQGGHTNHSTGEYHFHHGMSAHQHPNGICPYSSSNSSSGSSSSGGSSSYSSNTNHSASSYSSSSTTSYSSSKNSQSATSSKPKITLSGAFWSAVGVFILYKIFAPPKRKTNNSAQTSRSSNNNNISTIQPTQLTPAYDYFSCPKCGKRLVRRNSRYGPFYGCTGFPNCRYTRSIK